MNFDKLIASAGARLPKSLVDASARAGYSLTGSRPQTPHERAAEYYYVGLSLNNPSSQKLICVLSSTGSFSLLPKKLHG